MTASILSGGMPTAWQYADARRWARFQRQGPRDGDRDGVTAYEVCGLCGRRWEVAWRVALGFTERRVDAVEVWAVVFEHVVDHVNRMADE